MSDKLHTRDQVELGIISQYFKEIDLPAELLMPSNELPISTLIVPLMQDQKQRDRFLTFSFIPLSDDEIEHIRLLQIYTVVPVEWKKETRPKVDRLLQTINGRTAIGHFNINDDGEISYRYVCSVPGASILPKNEMLEIIDLFSMVLEMFAATIDGVADGSIELSDALRALD